MRRLLLTFVVATLVAAPSAAARTVRIGYSVDHRAIVARVLGPASAPRKILVVGCIHGNECDGLAIISALGLAPVRKGVQLWLVGEMNPDGTAAGTRQNAHGVDLNRNFPYRWEPILDPVYYAGPHPASEPETQAAMRLILRIKPAVTIWYHQHRDLVDMSGGGDRGVPRRYAQISSLRATCLSFLPGTAPLWQNHRLPQTTAFVVELPVAVDASVVARHVRAVEAMERGERSGSRTSCAS